MTSYPTPEFRRTALAPGILGAIVLIAGLALLDSGNGFQFIRFGVSILALIVGWFAIGAKHWWWAIPLAVVAVLWNPIWPLQFHGQVWAGAQFVAALVFIGAGVFPKIQNTENRNR